VGYLPADLPIDPRYTAGDVVDFYGRLRGGVGAASVASLLDRFELDPTRPVGELSTGNRRKVGIVQAVMHRPELLILDEPTSGLDPLLQLEFHKLVRELVADGTTVFLSSHVLPEVEELADRVAILRRGELVTVAAIQELHEQARQRITLRLAAPADAAPFAAIREVVAAAAEGSTLRLVVEGSVDRVIKTAAGYDVTRITVEEADLEDIFLDFYERDSA
jgi:ABC-2 type transport system ATP-binding protein